MRACLARRYWSILSVAIQHACADSLCEDPEDAIPAFQPLPTLETLLAHPDAPGGVDAPEVSRLPPLLG